MIHISIDKVIFIFHTSSLIFKYTYVNWTVLSQKDTNETCGEMCPWFETRFIE